MTFVKLRTFSFLVQINESTVAIKRKQTDKRRRVHTHTRFLHDVSNVRFVV